MNMDFYGYFDWGDVDAVNQFAMAHYFTHDAEANAIAKQFGRNIATYNVDGATAVDAWIALMKGELEEPPQSMSDWLEAHNDNHQSMLAAIGSGSAAGTFQAVDLSVVNFAHAEEMYDWMTLHQQLHQFEQAALGLS